MSLVIAPATQPRQEAEPYFLSRLLVVEPDAHFHERTLVGSVADDSKQIAGVLEHQAGPMNGFPPRISVSISSTGIGLAK